MFTEPSATCFRPVPEPPAFRVMETSGFFALNFAAASLARGSRAEEPETVTWPETLEPEAAALLAGAEFPPPQPAAATNAAPERATAIHFLRFMLILLETNDYCFCCVVHSVRDRCKNDRDDKVYFTFSL